MKMHLLLFLGCIIYTTMPNENQTTVEFKTNKHDFGTVDKKMIDFIEATFELTNPNENPLIIYKVDVSCGCMTPDYTKKPILKGQTGYVKIRLNVKQLGATFNKTAFVKTNAPGKDKGVFLIKVSGNVK